MEANPDLRLSDFTMMDDALRNDAKCSINRFCFSFNVFIHFSYHRDDRFNSLIFCSSSLLIERLIAGKQLYGERTPSKSNIAGLELALSGY